MSRINRAAQFAPFDALKGLDSAYRMKVYEHEKTLQGELSQDEILEISKTLQNLKTGEILEVIFFEDGYYKKVCGKAKLVLDENLILVNNQKIELNSIKTAKKP